MPNKVEAGFSLIGIMDGTSINGFLRVEGNPLVQRYNKGTSQFIPDFEADGFPEANLPVAVLILRDTSDGSVLIPQPAGIVWKYNGIELTFGSDNLCTTSGLEGVFKKIDSRTTQIADQSYNLPAIQVLKNLVPISGYDNDRLSVSGSVEVSGNSIPFSEISKEVIIQETTGNAFTMSITDDKGFYLVTGTDSLTAKCTIYKDGNEVSDYTGVTFKWEKLLGTGNVAMGTARTQTITNDDVDNVLLLRCTATLEGESISDTVSITDASDPYETYFEYTGITGNAIRKNETAVVTPKARRRSDGQNAKVSSWAWSIRDNSGAGFILTGKDSATFNAASATISWADMKRANMGINGSVRRQRPTIRTTPCRAGGCVSLRMYLRLTHTCGSRSAPRRKDCPGAAGRHLC